MRKIIMYCDKEGNENREVLWDDIQEKYIKSNFESVEIYTEKECVDVGLGFPKGDESYYEIC